MELLCFINERDIYLAIETVMSLAFALGVRKHPYYLFLVLQFLCVGCGTELFTGQTVVFPEIVERRSENGGKILKINQDLTLNLEKSSVVGEEFLLRTYQGHVMQHTYLDGEVLEEGLYHDKKTLASVVISEENGLEVEGILSPTLRIKPLIEEERTAAGKIKHILYEYTDDSELKDGKEIALDERWLNVSERQYYPNQGGRIPQRIYPELIILADSAFRAQFRSAKRLLRYIMITMNAVNLRYLTVSEPTVKLKFRALEILNYREERFMKYIPSSRMIIGIDTLEEFKNYVLKNKHKYDEYDGVYMITGLDMVQRLGHRWDPSLAGYAFIGGACGAQKVSLGEDRAGSFRGVRILAHEVGHLLGCPHDGWSSGYWSSRDCPWTWGYIMSYVESTSKSMKFSRCCNREMSRLVRSQEGACLRVVTVKRRIKKKRYIKLRPGDIYTRNYQCQIAFPNVHGTYYMPDDRKQDDCHGRCHMPAHVYGYVTYHVMFLSDNSPCNENGSETKVCINGDCRKKLPKYPVEPVTQ